MILAHFFMSTIIEKRTEQPGDWSRRVQHTRIFFLSVGSISECRNSNRKSVAARETKNRQNINVARLEYIDGPVIENNKKGKKRVYFPGLASWLCCNVHRTVYKNGISIKIRAKCWQKEANSNVQAVPCMAMTVVRYGNRQITNPLHTNSRALFWLKGAYT